MQMAAASEGCRQPLWRTGGVLASGIQESDLAKQSPAVSRSPTSWPRPRPRRHACAARLAAGKYWRARYCAHVLRPADAAAGGQLTG